jgi:hypothetical protein
MLREDVSAERLLPIATALRDAFREAFPEAFVQGDPEDGGSTVVDGRFDLLAVAALMVRSLSAREHSIIVPFL